VGDFNGDGKLDIATANSVDSTVSVLFNSGDTRGDIFSSPINFAVGNNPVSIAVGDFNGDGKTDIATASSVDSTVSVLFNTGDKRGDIFSSPINFAVGNNPVSIAVGDFNGDGKTDIATASSVDSTVSVLFNTGDKRGDIFYPRNYAVEGSLEAIAVGDFNGDGKLDIAMANGVDSAVWILLNGGYSFTFSSLNKVAVGNKPVSIAVGDFNGDGKLDIATRNKVSDTVSVLFNSEGVFSRHTEIKQEEEYTLKTFSGHLALGVVLVHLAKKIYSYISPPR